MLDGNPVTEVTEKSEIKALFHKVYLIIAGLSIMRVSGLVVNTIDKKISRRLILPGSRTLIHIAHTAVRNHISSRRIGCECRCIRVRTVISGIGKL